MFSSKKIIFINEVTDKIKDIIYDIGQKPKEDLKIFLFAQTLEKNQHLEKILKKIIHKELLHVTKIMKKHLGSIQEENLKIIRV